MEVTQTLSGFTRMRCGLCSSGFSLNATNGEPITFPIRGMLQPAEAIDAIIAHLARDLPEDEYAEHYDAARMFVGLDNNIEPALIGLAEHLPNVGITVYHMTDED